MVSSGRTGAPLSDVQVTIGPATDDARAGWTTVTTTTHTTSGGRFAFDGIPPGPAVVTASTIGYIFVRREVQVPPGGRLDLVIPLAEGTDTYEEVVSVTASPPTMPVGQMRELSSGALQELRGVAADDPVRAVQALPGVATGDDFQAEFSVRGSAFRHVGLVIDDVSTPLLFHAVRGAEDTGSIAMLNTDIISRASLQTGPHPARHGHWLGATLSFDVREGSRDRLAVRTAISGTNASTVVEGPLTPARRGSWLVSVRKSYVDWLVRKIDAEIDSTLGFVDAQGKVVYDLTPRQQMQVLVLGGDTTYRKDSATGANQIERATSRSALVSFAWRLATDRVLVTQRLSVAGNRFRNRGVYGQEQAAGDSTSLVWRGDLTVPVRRWTFEAGASSERQSSVTTLRNFAVANTTTRTVRAERHVDRRRIVSGAYANIGGQLAGLGLTAGLRGSHDTEFGQTHLTPWVMAERRIGHTRVMASASRAVQYAPLEVWSPTHDALPAERAWLLDTTVQTPLTSTVGLAVTAFTRREFDVLRRTSEHRLVDGRRQVESMFPLVDASLDSRTRGIDLVLERRATGGLTGWISYTWAQTTADDRHTGERFDGDFDQRHTLNVAVHQRLSWRMRTGARFRYGSNVPIVGYFDGMHDDLRLGSIRNQVRLPAYARLDLTASRTFTFERRRLTLFVEVMNATNRANYGPADGAVRSSLAAVNYSEKLLPILPSAGVLVEF